MIEAIYDLDNLFNSWKRVKKASSWKESTQRVEEDLLFYLVNAKEELENNTYKPTKPNTFLYNERGKLRNIESYTVKDKIVQDCLTNNVLLPVCRNKVIYDNAASLKDRGTDFFRRRLELFLRKFYKQYKNNGYILICDFSKFFDNIHHSVLINTLKDFGFSEEVINFFKLLLKQHEIDVSYMEDEEYDKCMDNVFNSIEYRKIPSSLKTGNKIMHKSMGIGSHIAQVAGVIVPYKIDNYCKIVKGIKYYGRYMDDFYVIHQDKEFLKELMLDIKILCKELGLIINDKKVRLVPLSHRFTLLKTQYCLCNNGKIIKIPDKQIFARNKRKLKKFKRENVPIDYVEKSQKSLRGAIVKRFGVTKSVIKMDELYNNLFKDSIIV